MTCPLGHWLTSEQQDEGRGREADGGASRERAPPNIHLPIRIMIVVTIWIVVRLMTRDSAGIGLAAGVHEDVRWVEGE